MSLAPLMFGLLAFSVLAPTSGCGGKTTEEAKEELERLKKKAKPKPAFDRFRVFTEPNERAFSDPDDDKKPEDDDKKNAKKKTSTDVRIVTRAIKPGHWTGVLVETKANHFDFSGELVSEPLNSQNQPIELDRNPFHLSTSRPAALPKGQRKTLETIFFAPGSFTPANGTMHNTWMANTLHNRQGGEAWRENTTGELLSHLPSYQYFMVALARDPDRYRYFKVLDSVRLPVDTDPVSTDDAYYYRLVTPRTTEAVALPTQSICWTSVAVVIWDRVLPTVLTPAQQQALVDWLHWGGALVVSGPETLDTLRSGFLEPYLPATTDETAEIGATALAELNQNWTIANQQGVHSPLEPLRPWSGIKLIKHPDAAFLPGVGKLVAERAVGRGRIVVTAFRLTERELINWRSYDSFVNACLLRRPNRVFGTLGRYDFVTQQGRSWRDRYDPQLVTGVRIFTRDAISGVDLVEASAQTDTPADKPTPAQTRAQRGTLSAGDEATADEIDFLKSRPGVAGWNDFSPVSSLARNALSDAARISVPKRDFVFWMLAIYLLLVVPVNWLLFRLLGRVEWAWIAVPIFAIGWGVVVVWQAQLDIGFVRAETELGVLEVYGGYPRAHLTRYTALYSSLSTNYDVHFAEPSAVAQPLATEAKIFPGQSSTSDVLMRTSGDRRRQLDNYLVSSNSTGMLHSEQIFDLGGSLDWSVAPDEPPFVENNTRWKLSGAIVLRRRANSENAPVDEWSWLGDMLPGARVSPRFLRYDEAAVNNAREEAPLTRGTRQEGVLNLRPLADFAQDFRTLRAGDVRLVAWRDQAFPGVETVPAASQSRGATLVVAHLKMAPLAAPTPDKVLPVRNMPLPGEEMVPEEDFGDQKP